MAGEHFCIALPSDDGFENRHSGHAGDVGDDIVQQQIHLLQRFLHMLNMH